MESNTPTLMQSEEARAPWNEKTKEIEVNISQTLSCTTKIIVPEDLEYEPELLENYVREQILLPSDLKDLEGWYVDDFCVM